MLTREEHERIDPLRVCSGQGARGGSKRQWGVCCDDPAILPLWWRLEDAKGHLRRFATPEAAYRAALRTNVIAEVHRYARSRADFLRSYAAAGERAWADANRYAGVRASLWSADPMGLFTADLPPLPRSF